MKRRRTNVSGPAGIPSKTEKKPRTARGEGLILCARDVIYSKKGPQGCSTSSKGTKSRKNNTWMKKAKLTIFENKRNGGNHVDTCLDSMSIRDPDEVKYYRGCNITRSRRMAKTEPEDCRLGCKLGIHDFYYPGDQLFFRTASTSPTVPGPKVNG